ncbi:MAG: hypothetical protein ACD_16C00079G0008 [uncultured bacterium]|nr:MAG: hypothetical protein ACD_16C00079G0008 [uncultured bacterium]
MKKLATLAVFATLALTVSAQAHFGCGECCAKKPVCDTCAPTMRTQRMEQVCTSCGVICCPRLGFWYNN